jgi:hypothetical protein
MTNIPINSDRYYDDNTIGYLYTASSDIVTIAAAILVGSAQGIGVYCNGLYNSNTLINNGNILSAGGGTAGVWFTGNNGHITNSVLGQIAGTSYGIGVDGNFEVIINHGKVFGFSVAGIFMGYTSNHASVINDGEIYGRGAGILAYSFNEGGTINNTGSGLIRSDHVGVDVLAPNAGVTTFITNGTSATIRGVDYSVHAHGGGRIQLTNDGKLIGNIRCDALNANDAVINRGIISGNMNLGSGNDFYNGQGGGTVTGFIQGSTGNDSFFAGKARDVLYGGANQDKFVFNAAVFSPAGASRDIIGDFHRSEADKIDVHLIDADLTHSGKQVFTFIGTDTFAHYHSLHASKIGMLRFDPGLDRLQGNLNGNFANAEFEVALPGLAALFANDLVLV